MISCHCLGFILFFPLISALYLENRAAQTVCGKLEAIQYGRYSLLSNHWGESPETPGSQCSELTSIHGSTVSWHSTYVWKGDGIKSFDNIQLNEGINKRLDAINSMPSTWHWRVKGRDEEPAVFDVAYDHFTSYTPGGSNANEIMVWPSWSQAKPISYEYDYSGKPLPVATSIEITDYTWDLYRGSNGYNLVYSFLLTDGPVNTFNGDMYGFLKYLIDQGYISSSEYLKTAQAGIEATAGNVTFTTTVYSLEIN